MIILTFIFYFKDSQNGKKNHAEDNITENENNENISRENGDSVEQNENGENQDIINGMETEQTKKKKKKSKKRVLETKDVQEEEPAEKKRLENNLEEKNEILEFHKNENVSKFFWKTTIIEIVTAKGEITLKKLRKKVVTQYLNHCSDKVSLEKANFKFDKKLKKVSGISIVEDKVILS